ncbi:isochorismate synthase [Psychromonas sp. CNPT3]|uniref:isochorismate synthase n=1 Tax=Psychromonas sp. CNPT3 TaxID=314282 RepID=UPI00006E9E95|nr:isochorismate synthase [Psychromonas sp. CNPT3]AGH82204.1 isochorismate synthase [Psychromonas sp. CNPT3]
MRAALENFAITMGNTPTSNISISIQALPLLPILKAQQNIFPAIYWHDKEQQQNLLCFGAIETHQQIPDVKNDALYIGGLAFHEKVTQWNDFPGTLFIRPAIVFKKENNKYSLTCHFNGTFSIQQCLHLLNKLQPPRALHKMANSIVSRQDIPSKHKWEELVKQASLCQDKISKVVLSRQSTLQCKNIINSTDLLHQYQQANVNNFLFSFQFSDKHVFIGCSPERLFSKHKQQLTTEALAGTVARGKTPDEDKQRSQQLLNDKKIKRENTLVQNFIVSGLQCLNAQVQCELPYVMQLHKVQHLCVPIHATLNPQTTTKKLLETLHPTPAVAGLPKKLALQFIEDHESYPRGWYAGTVGYIDAHKSDFSVAIRSALIANKSIKLFAGAGIVKGSKARQEWQELDHKIQTILTLLAT